VRGARKGSFWKAEDAKRDAWNTIAAEIKQSLLKEFNAAMDREK
jgi:hypothetical protein